MNRVMALKRKSLRVSHDDTVMICFNNMDREICLRKIIVCFTQKKSDVKRAVELEM